MTVHDTEDGDSRLAALRARGADRFDAVGFGYLEAVARRRMRYDGELRSRLDRTLAQALTDYVERFDRALAHEQQAVDERARQFPDSAQPLNRWLDAGDVRARRERASQLDTESERGPLSDLLRDMARPEVESGQELKAFAQSRSTWAALSVDRQLARSLAQAPLNPGPLNSHLLMLRALQSMRDISPAYLARFVSHAETLLWLDSAGVDVAASPDTATRPEPQRKPKPKPGRGKSA